MDRRPTDEPDGATFFVFFTLAAAVPTAGSSNSSSIIKMVGSPNKPTLVAPQFQQQVGGPHAAKQRSVLCRPSSSNRPASHLPPTSPSPPTHTENHSLPQPLEPAPPAGGTPFYCRQAGETKILNSHLKKNLINFYVLYLIF